jgi:hypothetical protein
MTLHEIMVTQCTDRQLHAPAAAGTNSTVGESANSSRSVVDSRYFHFKNMFMDASWEL